MAATNPPRPRVLVDADVLFAGSASPTENGASLLILRMAEIKLIEAVASVQVVAEVEGNLEAKLPQALPAFRLIVSRCLRIVSDPEPADLVPDSGCAHPQDLPILVTARRELCRWLVSFNVRHYRPGVPEVTVLRPGDLVRRVRDLLVDLPAGM